MTGHMTERELISYILDHGGYQLFYVPSRQIGCGLLMNTAIKKRKRLEEYLKIRNWSFRAIERLVPINWEVKNV